jgi:hypothetical protein
MYSLVDDTIIPFTPPVPPDKEGAVSISFSNFILNFNRIK